MNHIPCSGKNEWLALPAAQLFSKSAPLIADKVGFATSRASVLLLEPPVSMPSVRTRCSSLPLRLWMTLVLDDLIQNQRFGRRQIWGEVWQHVGLSYRIWLFFLGNFIFFCYVGALSARVSRMKKCMSTASRLTTIMGAGSAMVNSSCA